MKALVTGGAGFIGSHLVDKLVEAGHEVIVVDDLSCGLKDNVNPKADFLELDIKDEKIKDIFKKEEPEIVFHLAAQKNVNTSINDPISDAEDNIIGSLNIFECCKKNNIKVVFSSTAGVYGETKKLPISEESPENPLNPYGIAKLAVEKYLFYYQKVFNLPYISLRYSNVFGPRQDPKGEAGVVAVFLVSLLEGEQPTINGDGKQTRDFIYVDDVVEANIKAMQSQASGVYNIGTKNETSVNELFKTIVKLGKFNFPEKHGPALPGDLERSSLNYKKAEEELGFKPVVDLEEGLKATIEWFRKKI